MPVNIFVNGQHLVLLGIGGNVGDKNAVASIEVPVRVPDLPTAFALRAQDVAAAVGIAGLICTDRPLSNDEDGGYTVRFKFEGFNESISIEQPENVQLSFELDMAEEPIQTHPKFLGERGLAAVYRWEQQTGAFAKHRTPITDGKPALSGDPKAPSTNPLYGVESWLKVGGVFRRSYAVTTISASIYRGVGTIIDYPPDAEKLNIPRFKRRKWLKLAPNVQPSGSAYRVDESYRLTGQTNGSEAIIYSAGQLEE